MKRALISVVVGAALGIAAWALFAKLTADVQEIKDVRSEPAPRQVAPSWPYDRFSPGHSGHVLNQELDCNDCHDPSKPDFSGVDTGVCTACHEEQSAIAHMGSEREPTACFDCHSFKFESDADGPWDCVRCHGPFDTATHQGLAMHNSIACSNCHDPHEPVADTVGECTDCHREIDLRHGRPELSGTCADCHGGHSLATDAASCMQCHGEQDPVVPRTATFGGGHDSCATCHQGHSFSARTAVSCTSCHAQTVVLAQDKVRAHDECTSCHAAHAVRTAGDSTCKRCHADVTSTHPAMDGKNCVSCHEPHPERVTQIALSCSGCHEEAHSERAFHAEGTMCTDCHRPHEFDLNNLGEREFCVRCHAQQIRLTSHNLGHESCGSCHTGNAHHLGGPVACESCHEEILTTSPSGHQDCASCHEPHRGGVWAQHACTSCHTIAELPGLHRISDEVTGEGHTECTACHDVHVSRARADRATCVTCHEDIANHEPDAKRCTGCHTFTTGRKGAR